MKRVSRRRSRNLSSAVAGLEPLESRCLLSSSPLGFTPAQIAQAYGINSIKFGSVVGNGAGQTIAIVNAYDNPDLVSSTDPNFDNSDLHKFDVQFGLNDPPSFTKVNQTGGTTYPAQSPAGTDTTTSWAGEADLDVEWAHAIAPQANILLVEADSGSLLDLIGNPSTDTGGAVDYARHAAGVSVVSMSFGVSEFGDGTVQGSETSYDTFFTTPSGHAGETFVAASGDSGQPGLYPGFSPNVVAVGDTSLTLDGSNYGSESGFIKSGGGVSQYEAKPSYQSGITLGSKRMTPDVSFDGDPNTGVPIYDSFDSQGPWIKLGGTSFSTPVWSALIAIADQGRAARSQGPLDGPSQSLPMLYGLSSSDFHDITTQDDGSESLPVGYDLVTGRGTPIANKLVPNLAGYTTTVTTGSISGTIFNDANGNGKRDSGESGISGWTVYNDANNNGKLDPGELTTTTTDASGDYTLSGLAAGNYKIREILPTGWKQTTPSNNYGWTIALTTGENATAKNFGAESTGVVTTGGSVSGTVFNDVNGDGLEDDSETGLSDWTVYDDANNNGKLDSGELSTTTTASGLYTFAGLAAGNYKIRALIPAGWKQTTPAKGYGWTLSLSTDQVLTGKSFGAQSTTTPPPPPQGASASGTVFNDANGDKQQDDGETGLSGWTVYLDLNNSGSLTAADPKAITNGSGVYDFTDLSTGSSIIRVMRPSGWTQTTPTNNFGRHVTLSSNENATGLSFGEQS